MHHADWRMLRCWSKHPPVSPTVEFSAKTVWLRLVDRVLKQGGAPPELLAVTALAGLATGLRPQGFEKPAYASPPRMKPCAAWYAR